MIDKKKAQEVLNKSPIVRRMTHLANTTAEQWHERINAGECNCTEDFLCMACRIRMKALEAS